MDLQDRMFRDNPLAQDYLRYIQKTIEEGVPLSTIETPEAYYLRMSDPGTRIDATRLANTRIEEKDERYRAIKRIYDLLASPDLPERQPRKGKK